MPRQSLAAFELTTGVATPWNPSVVGTVGGMAVNGQTLYLGGSFTQVGSSQRTNLAAVDIGSGQVTDWNPGANGGVNALAIGGGRVYVGANGITGGFTAVANQPRTNLAAIDFKGIVAPWAPAVGFNSWAGHIWTILVAGNTVFVGGNFNSIAGLPRTSLAAFDTQTGNVTSFSPAFQAAARYWDVSGWPSEMGGHYFRQVLATLVLGHLGFLIWPLGT